MKGVTQVPLTNRKTLVPTSQPTHPWRTVSGTFSLCTVPVWIWIPWTVMYVFSHMISCRFLSCKCRKVGLVCCCNTMTMSLHSLSACCGMLSYLRRISIKAVYSLKPDIYMLVGVENKRLNRLRLHKSLDLDKLIYLQAKCSGLKLLPWSKGFRKHQTFQWFELTLGQIIVKLLFFSLSSTKSASTHSFAAKSLPPSVR